MRTRQHGVLAPRASTIVTLTLRRAGGGGESTLTFVDLAGGDPMLGGSAAAVARAKGKGGAARSLAALGAAVAARAEGATRRAGREPWNESTLSLLLRESLCGDSCTAVLGACGTSEADLEGTLGTLLFLRKAQQLRTWVRPSPHLAALQARLAQLKRFGGAAAAARHRRRRRAPRRRRARRGADAPRRRCADGARARRRRRAGRGVGGGDPRGGPLCGRRCAPGGDRRAAE